MDPGDLLMMMEKFDPRKQQQEQLANQALMQQLGLGLTSDERAAATHAAAQARQQQLDPVTLEAARNNAAIAAGGVARLPLEQEAAQYAANLARFNFGQAEADAPLARAAKEAAFAASLAGPQFQHDQLALQRSEAERKALHDAAVLKATEDQNRNTRLGTVLDVLRQGGVPGMVPNAVDIATMSGNLLRPAGSEAALNQFLTAGDPTGGQRYLTEHPEVKPTPEMAAILAKGAAGGTSTGTVPGAGAQAPVPLDPNAPLTDWQGIVAATRATAPAVRGAFGWMQQQAPGSATEQAYLENLRKQREALQRR